MAYYEPIHENFVRFCKVRARGVLHYEDLVSEATLKAYQHWDKISNKSSLKYFLFTTARNIVLNLVRKRSDLSLEEVSKEPSSNNRAEKDMEIEYLYQQLDKLTDIKREAIVLFEINGFSIKEIAKIQGINEGAVKVNLSRARKELMKLMQDEPVKKMEAVTS